MSLPGYQPSCLFFLLLSSQLGCSRSEPRSANVVLITIDTFRADHLHAAGYPRETTPVLDSLARSGALFTTALSPAPETAPTHASILTGLYPPQHGVRANGVASLPQEATTIAEILAESGYRTGAFVGSFVLDSRFGLDQGFEVYDDTMPESSKERNWYGNVITDQFRRRAGLVTDAAISWLKSVQRDDATAPFFLWVHYYDPHAPYRPPEEHDTFPKIDAASRYRDWQSLEEKGGGIGAQSEPQVSALLADLTSLYDGEIHYCDAEVGRLLACTRELRAEGETLIIVTSDHGESLTEHGYYFRHGWHLYDNVLRVPLIISWPGRVPPGQRIDEQIELVSLFATIVSSVAGAPPASYASAPTLLPAITSPFPPAIPADPAYSETFLRQQLAGESPIFAVRTPRWKFIADSRFEHGGQIGLYDLNADPEETTNLVNQWPDVSDSLCGLLALRVEALTDSTLNSASRLGPETETLQGMRALGYIR